jgi:hypothetical protein
MALHDLAESETQIILKAEDIPSIKQRLVKYNDRTQIPNVDAISVVTVTVPTIISSATFSATNPVTGEELAATFNGPLQSLANEFSD